MKTLKLFLIISLILVMQGVIIGQSVSINDDGSLPNTSAILDVKSASKGMLPPRVALTTTISGSPITDPAASLLVYNTATAGIFPSNVTPGYYYWSGSEWLRFTNESYASYDTQPPSTSDLTLILPGFENQYQIIIPGAFSGNGWAVPSDGTIQYKLSPNCIATTIFTCNISSDKTGSTLEFELIRDYGTLAMADVQYIEVYLPVAGKSYSVSLIGHATMSYCSTLSVFVSSDQGNNKITFKNMEWWTQTH